MTFRFIFILLHGLAALVSLRVAFMLRFYFDPLPYRYDEMLLRALPWALLFKTLAADGMGLTRRIWRYASIRDLKAVFLAALLGSAGFIPAVLFFEPGKFPNGPLLLDFLLTLGLFTVIRFSGRFWMEATRVTYGGRVDSRARVLIVGAGDRGELAMRLVQADSRVVGFLDDAPGLQGRLLLGRPILGRLADLAAVLQKKRVDDLVISLLQPGPEKIRWIFELGSAAGCHVSLMPEFIGAGPHAQPIRELKMGDFLGREAVQLDPAPLRSALGGMTVLVTGAGGSIGSELCRQLVALPVKKLLLLDYAETGLFEISEELKQMADGGGMMADGSSQAAGVGRCNMEVGEGAGDSSAIIHPPSAIIEVILCDIRFPADLQAVFERHQPQVVYHAAACKHVPMMEAHPLEAARTNVLGTRNVVAAAKAAGVKRLLHVSTDKVVAAEGVMGASKAWGEAVVRAAGYSCVRFGNVLGSSGSVIPLFEKQWTRDGVLQVTHPDATRYFMTIEEAVLLILHAEALQGRGEVYILDMGEPVKIFDLAKQVLALKRGGGNERPTSNVEHPTLKEEGDGEENANVEHSTLNIERRNFVERQGTGDGGAGSSPTSNSQLPTPARSAPPGIRIIGLRPGERIHERLHTSTENLLTTTVPKVNKLSGSFTDPGLETLLKALEAAIDRRDETVIRQLLFGSW